MTDTKYFVGLMLIALLTSPAIAQNPVPAGAVVEKIVGGFQFIEGPVWKDSVGLLFSDITGNTIYHWTPDSGAKALIFPSGGTNGLILDPQGRIIAARQGGDRNVVRFESDGSVTTLASTYRGKHLNSPNDLVLKSDGSIFFTDPDWGLTHGQKSEIGFTGVYRRAPDGRLQALDSTLKKPNGIVFSLDEKHLFVNDSTSQIFVYDVIGDTALANRRVFATMTQPGGGDGMKIDLAGNIFSVGPKGIWVFSPQGIALDTIIIPGQTTNCNWGDKERKILYITAATSLYRIRLNTTAVQETGWRGNAEGSGGISCSAFPNPFNAASTIRYTLPTKADVRLTVLDALGRTVENLAEGTHDAGVYEVRFDATQLSSGVYFCRLNAGNAVQTTRLVLLR